MELTQKETELLKDLKTQEKLCVEKYNKYSAVALDPQLKELFTQIANVEQQHFNTVCEMEKGNAPVSNSGGGQGVKSTFSATYKMGDSADKMADQYLCTDLLTTEKHASALYDTCVFEFRSTAMRDALNHIQKEEQQHGKALYDYMSVNSMY